MPESETAIPQTQEEPERLKPVPSDVEASGTEVPSEDEVLEALKSVIDPELGINIVDLGLVYEVDVAEGGDVDIQYTLTTMGCPIGPLIEDQMRAFLAPALRHRRGEAGDGAPPGLDPRDDVGRGQGRYGDVLGRTNRSREGLEESFDRGGVGEVLELDRRPGRASEDAPLTHSYGCDTRCTCIPT